MALRQARKGELEASIRVALEETTGTLRLPTRGPETFLREPPLQERQRQIRVHRDLTPLTPHQKRQIRVDIGADLT